MNIKTTANSISRSNIFNLFIIFFDAVIVVIYDVKRSKYVMLVKKQKRFVLKMSSEQKRKIMTWWKVGGFFAMIAMITYIVFIILKMSNMISNIVLAIPFCIANFFGSRVIYSSSTKSYKVFCMLVQERRVIFQYILLGILFYIDNFYLDVSAAGISFPITTTLLTMYLSSVVKPVGSCFNSNSAKCAIVY